MNPPLHSFFEWLLRSPGQAGVLTVLVLLAQFGLGKRLDGRWRHLLWFLVLARLVLPWSPPSPASLYNYVYFERPAASRPPSPPAPALAAMAAPEISAPMAANALSIAPVPAAAPEYRTFLPATPKARWTMPLWPVLLAVAWMVGVIVFAARLVVQNVLFRRRLRSATPLNDQPTIRLFESCRSLMRVSSCLEVLETELVDSPALYGLVRLRLLLPLNLTERFSKAELRHIFLHEFGHVRRRDMPLQWLITGLQVVHWFNPVLWFGFRRMAADRELACDELALSVVGEAEGAA